LFAIEMHIRVGIVYCHAKRETRARTPVRVPTKMIILQGYDWQ